MPMDIDQLNPQLLDTLMRILLLHAVKEAPPDVQKHLFHSTEGLHANDPRVLAGLQRHQLALHKKLFDAAHAGSKQSQPAPTPNSQPPSGSKTRPFANATSKTRAIFGGASDNDSGYASS